MLEKFVIGGVTFVTGFLLKSFIMSAKERADVRDGKRKRLNEMKEQYHQLADDIGKKSILILKDLEISSMDKISLEDIINFRLTMDRYIQYVETVCGNAYDNHFDHGAFDREFLHECKKIASKTIPGIYSLTVEMLKIHSVDYTAELHEVCPNLLRLLKGKLLSEEFEKIQKLYNSDR